MKIWIILALVLPQLCACKMRGAIQAGRDLQQGSFTVDFAGYSAGDIVTNLQHGITVSSKKRQGSKTGPLVDASAMIFDSSNPTGGDEDLGSPNTDFGGPGKGGAGKEGSEVANKDSRGMILIISEDNDSNNPDDHRFGGYVTFDFAEPMVLENIGLLDNEEDTVFEVVTPEGDEIEIVAGKGGNNSFETISFEEYGGAVAAVQIKVTFKGSGAITHLQLSPATSPLPTLAPVTAPSSAPVPTLSPTTPKACDVAEFMLWDAGKNAPLFPIENEGIYCTEEWPKEVTIEALTQDCVKYVKIALDGPTKISRVEGVYPFIISGDRKGIVKPIDGGLRVGDYVISAFPDGNKTLKRSVSFSLKSC